MLGHVRFEVLGLWWFSNFMLSGGYDDSATSMVWRTDGRDVKVFRFK